MRRRMIFDECDSGAGRCGGLDGSSEGWMVMWIIIVPDCSSTSMQMATYAIPLPASLR
jgi:hypothetical protein